MLFHALLAAPGCLLGREALMAADWRSAVADDSLVQRVGELRTKPPDDRDEWPIPTIPAWISDRKQAVAGATIRGI